MKNNKIFNINDIITIVMEEVRILENKEIYNIQEEAAYPLYIYNKIDELDGNEVDEFLRIVDKIAEDIILIKSGELNELNKCHEEIIYLAEEYLNSYLEG